jgi:hypothetical protein
MIAAELSSLSGHVEYLESSELAGVVDHPAAGAGASHPASLYPRSESKPHLANPTRNAALSQQGGLPPYPPGRNLFGGSF